jgi:hypothetical protein
MPCRGEWHSPFRDTDAFPYLPNNGTIRLSISSGFHFNIFLQIPFLNHGFHGLWVAFLTSRDAMLRVFSPAGFHFNNLSY